MASPLDLLKKDLMGSVKQRFEELSQNSDLDQAERSEKSFTLKVIKYIISNSAEFTDGFDRGDLVAMSEVSDPCEYMREKYPFTVFGNFQVIKESMNLMVWLHTGYRRTEAWKAFSRNEYRTTAFQVLGDGIWVVTRDMLNRQCGVARIRIPAADQFPDADVLPLKQYILEVAT
jgi:hypothetical protein